MSNDPKPTTDQRPAPDPAVVLGIVAAIARLPKTTLKTLRLVCRATRVAVDHGITEFDLPAHLLGQVSEDSAILGGLTSLRSHRKYPEDVFDDTAIKKVFTIACRTSETLQKLDLIDVSELDAPDESNFSALGARQWPQLRSLSFCARCGIFESCINVDCMPELIDMRLQCELDAGDVAALARCARFASNVEVLDMKHVFIV